jgi:ubiquinone/menaquinone biosynthesis C-methylase UbiE
MPSLEQNRDTWGEEWDWSHAGDEWGRMWGDTDMQWHHTLVPRLKTFLPASRIVEIGTGYGRWAEYLHRHADDVFIVDLSEKCIDACRVRFADQPKISCHVNDGTSLSFVEDRSVDLVFSFDSLVHAEADVIEAYVHEIAAKLADGGTAFLHHSNLATYARYRAAVHTLPDAVSTVLNRNGVVEKLEAQWRAITMSAEKIATFAGAAGLQCISQEKINWNSRRLIDCITVLGRRDAAVQTRIIDNPHFMREARYARMLHEQYRTS